MTSSDQPMDHVPPGAESGDKAVPSDLQRNMTAGSTWVRLFFIIIFALLYGLSRLVTAAVVVVQFFHVLITGEINGQLKTFGHSLAIYSFEVVDYLTFNSDTKPFPLEAAWPDSLPGREDATTAEAEDA